MEFLVLAVIALMLFIVYLHLEGRHAREKFDAFMHELGRRKR